MPEPHAMQLPLIVLFTVLGLSTHIIFMFQRAWLNHPARLRSVVAAGAMLFVTALILEHAGVHTKNDFFLILKMPLLSLACYKALQWGLFVSSDTSHGTVFTPWTCA